NLVNISPATGVEQRLVEKLRESLDAIPWLGNWSLRRRPNVNERGFDFIVKLPLPKGRGSELWVQCKADPRPSEFPYIDAADARTHPPVLVFGAPFITSRMAAACAEAGWSWFDLAGNCLIDVPGVLHVERSGQVAVHQRPRPLANLGTGAAGRVI